MNSPSIQPQHGPDSAPFAAASEIFKRFLRDVDQVHCNERHAFRGTLLFRFDAALPLKNRPAVVSVLRQLGKHAGKIDLAVAQASEAAGPFQPWLVARINALAPVRVEFRIPSRGTP